MNYQLATRKPEDELVSEWQKMQNLDVKAGDITQTTGATYRRGMAKFVEWLRSKDVDMVTSQVIQEWKADLKEQGMKPSSINTWFAGVKRFYEWAVNAGMLTSNPTTGVRGVKRKGTSKRHKRDALTDHEVLRVLAQPDRETPQGKRDYAILCLMAFCALRTIEIHRADLEDLSTVDGMLTLRVHGKGSSEKDEIAVIFHERAQEAVYDWIAERGDKPGPLFTSFSRRSLGSRLGLSAIRHMVIGYYKEVGIKTERKTAHSLRHSAISKIARHNVLKARQVAGHTSLDTTMIYVHENDRLSDPGEQYIDYINGNGG